MAESPVSEAMREALFEGLPLPASNTPFSYWWFHQFTMTIQDLHARLSVLEERLSIVCSECTEASLAGDYLCAAHREERDALYHLR